MFLHTVHSEIQCLFNVIGSFEQISPYNTELIELRKNYLRKSVVSVGRISVCNVSEHLAEHGIHCLPCSYTIDVIDTITSY